MINKITIIGGSGFLGQKLCKLLYKKGIDFEVLDIKKNNNFLDFTKIADIRCCDSLRENITGNVVVNLAAVHHDDAKKEEYFMTNVVGAKNLAKVITEKNIQKLVFTSSVAVYGFAPPNTDESGKISPFNEYGKTKYEAEKIFNQWQADCDTNLSIIRPTVIFGEGNRGNIYNLMNQIYKNRFLMIGNGRNKKSIAYVDNVAYFLFHCIKSKKKIELYNYVDSPDLDMNELVSLICKTLFGMEKRYLKIPYIIGYFIGLIFDLFAFLLNKKFTISRIRIQKFCSFSQFTSTNRKILDNELSLRKAVIKTLNNEFRF
jgi:nucleoside-diphosphate-sugar epimerase